MTQPRYIVEGTTYLLTRRCLERRFLLVPRARVERIFGYCLAVLARRHGVAVHAVMVMSNHVHTVVTDERGVLGSFLQDLHSQTARCLNAHLGRWENVWAVRQASAVRLADAEAVWDALTYTLTNPVAARLVRTHRRWPGLHSAPRGVLDRPRVFRRPRKFYGPRSRLPEMAALRLTQPPLLAGLRRQAYADELARRVAAREAALQSEAAAAGRTFLGPAAVLRQSIHGTPKQPAPRRRLSPQVAAADKETRRAECRRLATFRAEHAAALSRWRDGDRETAFPHGTYKMRRLHGVRCLPRPGP